MHPKTSQALRQAYEQLCSWEGSFIFPTSHGNVDLIEGMGPNAKTLSHLPMQPKCYPRRTSYLFDPSVFRGLDSADELIDHVIVNLPGSSMYKRGNYSSSDNVSTRFRVCCSYTCSADATDNAKFDTYKFTKNGVRKAKKKRQRKPDKTAFDRMPDRKLRDPRNNFSGNKRKRNEPSSENYSLHHIIPPRMQPYRRQACSLWRLQMPGACWLDLHPQKW